MRSFCQDRLGTNIGRALREESTVFLQQGLVAQDTQLFGSTVEENIAYGLEPHEYLLRRILV
jgi:energy-coupling factor transporter ATP-binding protein EcfA2